jgi:hypothetical protein
MATDDFEEIDLVDSPKDFQQWQPAPPLQRVYAFLVDSLIVLIILELIMSFSQIKPPMNAHIYLWVILMWAWEGMCLSFWGKTPARHFFKLSIYSPKDDAPPSPIQVCVRILVFWSTTPLLGLGLTPILFRSDRSGWHEQLSETVTTTTAIPAKKPSPRWKRLGHSLVLVQALVVFAAGGATLLTQGLNLSRPVNPIFDQLKCDDERLAFANPQVFLSALILSPSWNICWQTMRQPLAPFSSSSYFQLLDLTHKAHKISLYNSKIQGLLYRKELAPMMLKLCQENERSKDCATAQFLASLWSPQVTSPPQTQHWLSNYSQTIKDLIDTAGYEKRLELMRAFINDPNIPAMVKTAMEERLWAEMLPRAYNELQTPPFSPNTDWLHEQICWREALALDEDDLCSNNPFRYGVQFIKKLQLGQVSTDEAENFLGDNRQLPEDIERAIHLWIAVEKKNTTIANKLWRESRPIDPLFNYLSKWYEEKQN